MCGTYGFDNTLTWDRLAQLARLSPGAPALNLPPHAQFYPGSMAPIVCEKDGMRLAETMYWGLVPPFWKKPLEEKRFSTFNYNSRAPDWLEKPSFRDAIRHRRCLVPATYFIEYTGPRGARTPVRFGRPGGEPFAMAGVWSPWHGLHKGEAVRLDTFTILTTDANAVVRPVHPQAMPVVLDWRDADVWMDAPLQEAVTLARPAPGNALVRL